MSSQTTPFRVHRTPCCCPPDCPGHPDYNNANVTTSSSSPSSKPSRPGQEASAHGPMASFYLALIAGHYDKQIRNLQSQRRNLTGSSAPNHDSKAPPACVSAVQMKTASKAALSEAQRIPDEDDFFPTSTCKCSSSANYSKFLAANLIHRDAVEGGEVW